MKSQLTYQPVREHSRLTAKQRALVLLPQREDPLPYHIIDISEGGLSFRYLGKKLKYSEIDKISLYHENELIVDSIPVGAVSDYRLRDNLVPVRRSSICFSALNNEQQRNLGAFIQKHTETSR